MGMYEETHFGVYFIADERVIESTEDIRVCSKDKSHVITEFGYCPECGNKVEKREKLKSEKINLVDFEEMVDRFILPECDTNNVAGKVLGISNLNAGRIDVEYEIVDFENIEEMVKEMFNEFMEYHKDDIKYLAEHVFNNVEIRFGVFKYYM
jgi:hypothetical protein